MIRGALALAEDLPQGRAKPHLGDRNTRKCTMSVAATLAGVVAHRLRRYEAAGLLRPARSMVGKRLYTDAEVELIEEIARIEGEGMNLEEVKAVLAMRRGERG